MNHSPAAAPASPSPSSYEAFHDRLATRDRGFVDRHLARCDEASAPGRAQLWRRLAAVLSELSPHSVRMAGQRAALFFVADGIYCRQVFAIEDCNDGRLAVYATDVMDEAVAAGVLLGPVVGDGNDGGATPYAIPDTSARLGVESLNAKGTTSAPEYYRHMLGWNRRAVRITLSSHAKPEQVAAVEAVCRLAAARMAPAH
jgi:hypothetical protein